MSRFRRSERSWLLPELEFEMELELDVEFELPPTSAASATRSEVCLYAHNASFIAG